MHQRTTLTSQYIAPFSEGKKIRDKFTVESLRPDRARGRESPRGPKPACRIGPAHFPRHQKPPFMQTPTTIRKLSVQKPEHILLLFRTILVKYRKSIEARSLL